MVGDCTINRNNKNYFEIRDEKVVFFSKSKQYERNLSIFGVAIPAHLQKNFENQQFITKDHRLFTRAFVQIYFPNVLKKIGFQMFPKNGNPPVNEIKNLKIED